MNTENQSSELWCPMVRAAILDMAAENRDRECNDNPQFARCIASKCAMWRWAEHEPWPQFKHCDSENYSAQEEPERPASIPSDWIFCPDDGEGAGWREPEEIAAATRRGYCGIAGKPLGAA